VAWAAQEKYQIQIDFRTSWTNDKLNDNFPIHKAVSPYAEKLFSQAVAAHAEHIKADLLASEAPTATAPRR
jgi:hypothetical protein